jgi:hypothetical protein
MEGLRVVQEGRIKVFVVEYILVVQWQWEEKVKE